MGINTQLPGWLEDKIQAQWQREAASQAGRIFAQGFSSAFDQARSDAVNMTQQKSMLDIEAQQLQIDQGKALVGDLRDDQQQWGKWFPEWQKDKSVPEPAWKTDQFLQRANRVETDHAKSSAVVNTQRALTEVDKQLGEVIDPKNGFDGQFKAAALAVIAMPNPAEKLAASQKLFEVLPKIQRPASTTPTAAVKNAEAVSELLRQAADAEAAGDTKRGGELRQKADLISDQIVKSGSQKAYKVGKDVYERQKDGAWKRVVKGDQEGDLSKLLDSRDDLQARLNSMKRSGIRTALGADEFSDENKSKAAVIAKEIEAIDAKISGTPPVGTATSTGLKYRIVPAQ